MNADLRGSARQAYFAFHLRDGKPVASLQSQDSAMRIALATSKDWPDLTPDDRTLLQPLADRGLKAEPAVWSDPNYPWRHCDAIVIRSCWDYHVRSGEFLRWIAFLESTGCNLWNPAAMIRWNADKSYLRSLENQGIPIVPTLWCEPGETPNLAQTLRNQGWAKAVVKPRISATAHRTQLVETKNAEAGQSLFEELMAGPGVMVQKFMDSIVTEGEWSLIFFGGQFSHAVLKTAKPGDFRVQNDFGGASHPADPPAHVLECAIRAIRTVGYTLYARVDGVVDRARNEDLFRIMELELIEPALFLTSHSAATGRFADVIAEAVRSRESFRQDRTVSR
jgi:glutathione synthase/RimK-type ligase-like ATP-grasp enzyme